MRIQLDADAVFGDFLIRWHPSRFDPLSPSGLVRQSELKCQKPGCAVLREVLTVFGAFSTGFAHEVLRSAPSLRRGVVGRGLRSRRGASSFSPAVARQLRVFACCSALCLNTCFRFFKLLASMLYMLLVSSPHGVAVKIDTRCAGFNTVKITPARCRDVKRIAIAFCSGSFPQQHDRPNPEKYRFSADALHLPH